MDRIAANAERFDQATKFGALDMINRVALPAATAMSEVVVRIEEGSSQLAKKVAGKPAVVKAAAKKAKTVKKAVAKTVKKATATKKAVVRKTTVAARKTRAAVSKAAAALIGAQLSGVGASRCHSRRHRRPVRVGPVPSAFWALSRRCHRPDDDAHGPAALRRGRQRPRPGAPPKMRT